MDREHLEYLIRTAEERHKASAEAASEFIKKYSAANHNRVKELMATGMEKRDAYMQAIRENSNSTYEIPKISP